MMPRSLGQGSLVAELVRRTGKEFRNILCKIIFLKHLNVCLTCNIFYIYIFDRVSIVIKMRQIPTEYDRLSTELLKMQNGSLRK